MSDVRSIIYIRTYHSNLHNKRIIFFHGIHLFHTKNKMFFVNLNNFEMKGNRMNGFAKNGIGAYSVQIILILMWNLKRFIKPVNIQSPEMEFFFRHLFTSFTVFDWMVSANQWHYISVIFIIYFENVFLMCSKNETIICGWMHCHEQFFNIM